jgi:ABC-type antimicrobial peptide transport system permease subunit
MKIVGVVGNVKYLGLAVNTDPAYYMPFAQGYGPQMYLVVRSSGDADGITPALRRQIQALDPDVALARISTMEESLNLSISQPRFNALLLALFASIALGLATVGIYGVTAYMVAQRTHEIGVLMALGAAQAEVVRIVIAQGASLAAIGIVIGLGAALALTRLLSTMTFGVGVKDAFTFGASPLAILLVVLLATFVPALRATRISPVIALRDE